MIFRFKEADLQVGECIAAEYTRLDPPDHRGTLMVPVYRTPDIYSMFNREDAGALSSADISYSVIQLEPVYLIEYRTPISMRDMYGD